MWKRLPHLERCRPGSSDFARPDEAGGSDSPDRLLAKLGVNVTDPSFWELGLTLLDDMVSEAEGLAAAL